MSHIKYCLSAAISTVGQLTKEDWLFIISITISFLGMIADYLGRRKDVQK